MSLLSRYLIVAAGLLVALFSSRAETPLDPSGHWKGAIQAPSGDVQVEVDIARDERGVLAGTLDMPSDSLTGYSLRTVTVDGTSVNLVMHTGDAPPQTFAGRLSADGTTISGDFLVSVYAVPFTLTRSGDARIAPAPRSPAIATV